MAKKQEGPAFTPITITDEWAAVAGPSATKDCLFVVEVYAGWCGPTDAITQTARRLQIENAGRKLKFVQVCADLVDAFEKYRLTSRPNFALYREGMWANSLLHSASATA